MLCEVLRVVPVRDGVVLDAGARFAETPPDRARFAAGARVFHQKFGYGTVADVDTDKLEIDFDKAGRKKVVASFVDAA